MDRSINTVLLSLEVQKCQQIIDHTMYYIIINVFMV